MGKSGKKPRHNKMDAKRADGVGGKEPKKEKDWGFDDIVRSKKRGY